MFLFLSHLCCFHGRFIEGLGKGDQLLACQNIYWDTAKQSELWIVVLEKAACWGQAFMLHRLLDNTWCWHLGAVSRMHHSTVAREYKLDLEQCIATSEAVAVYQNSIGIWFFFFSFFFSLWHNLTVNDVCSGVSLILKRAVSVHQPQDSFVKPAQFTELLGS